MPATAVILQLLAWPGFAAKVIQGAVNHYALSAEAARVIDGLPQDLVR